MIPILFVKSVIFAQPKSTVTISSEKNIKQGTDLIRLAVKNQSLAKTFYYSIVLKVHIDTGWISLLSDINSLGKNEFLHLKAIKPGETIIKPVSLKQIALEYYYYKDKELKFGVMYYEKPTLKSKGSIEFLSPFKL